MYLLVQWQHSKDEMCDIKILCCLLLFFKFFPLLWQLLLGECGNQHNFTLLYSPKSKRKKILLLISEHTEVPSFDKSITHIKNL